MIRRITLAVLVFAVTSFMGVPLPEQTVPNLTIQNLTGARFRITVTSVCYQGPHATPRIAQDVLFINEHEEIQSKNLPNYQKLMQGQSCLIHNAQFNIRGTICMIAYCHNDQCIGKACQLIDTNKDTKSGITLFPQDSPESPLYIMQINNRRFEVIRKYPTSNKSQIVYTSQELPTV